MEFREWIGKISDADMHAVEAFLIGDCGEREALSRMIRERSDAPVLCLNERHSLDDTLGLFAAGVDDVVRKPVHVREILARVGRDQPARFRREGPCDGRRAPRLFRRTRARGERRAVSAAAPRAAHSRVSAALPRPARQQDADLQRRLRAFRRERRRKRDRKPYQQASQEAEDTDWDSTRSIPSASSAIASRNKKARLWKPRPA